MIGIFDSGIGGLTVVKEILQRYPDADFVYLGDTARAPYGDRSPETIREFSREDVAFLVSHGITDVVIACNSASANALPYLKTIYPEINFYGVVEPTIKTVVEGGYNSIAILGTRATINSSVYQDEIASRVPAARVVGQPCPLLVPWVEEGFMGYQETSLVVRHYTQQILATRPDCVVLACTHYPPLLTYFEEVLGPTIKIITSSAATADNLPSHLFLNNSGSRKFCFTDVTPHLMEMVKDWLGKDVLLQKVEL